MLTHDQLLVPPVVAALGLEPILLFAGNALCRLYVLYILRDFVQPLFLVSWFFLVANFYVSLFFLLLLMFSITHGLIWCIFHFSSLSLHSQVAPK